MSLFISETVAWLKNADIPFEVTGGTQISGGAQITGSLSIVEATAIGSGTLGAPVLVLSGSGGPGHLSGSIGLQLTIGYTGSLAAANPTSAQLSLMFPNFTTGSLVMVGSGSESWLAFKDIAGAWRTVTASFAA